MPEQPAEIVIHTELIPNAVRDRLAIATMQFIRSVLADPQQRAVFEDR